MKKLKFSTFLLITIAAVFVFATASSHAEQKDEVMDEEKFTIYFPYVSNAEPPPPVFIIPNHSFYVEGSGYLNIVGEVYNNTTEHLNSVVIGAKVFDENDRFLKGTSKKIHLSNLPAGEKTCFHLSLKEPAGWSYYRFDDPDYSTGGNPLPNLTVYNDNGSYVPQYRWYEITGRVRNDYGARVKSVKIVGTLYNDFGFVVGCEDTIANKPALNDGEDSYFELTFFGRNYTDVTSYRLQVDGIPK